MCAVFVLGRLSHAVGLSMKKTVNTYRFVGTVLTVAVGLSLGVRLAFVAIPHLPVMAP
jgi:hypothetical protein